jgi:AcrR family transcriptional regulator
MIMRAPSEPRAKPKKVAVDTRQRILRAAVNEFAGKGFSGGRIDAICASARVNIRMIYHHFGGKEDLYIAVLEETLGGLRNEELKLDFEAASPMDAMLQLFEFTYEHFAAHPRLISLLSGENLLKAKFLKRSKLTPRISSPVLAQLRTIIDRGEAEGIFRIGIDPLQLYVLIVSLSYFHLSNGYTLSVIFERDIFKPDWLAQHKQIARDVVVRYVQAL